MGAQPSQFSVATVGDTINNNKSSVSDDPILSAHSMDDPPPMEERRQEQRIFDDKNEATSPATRKAIQVSLVVLLLSTMVTLLVFLILFGRGNNYNDQDEGGGPDEERSKAGKLKFAMIWMLLAALGLSLLASLPFWKGMAITAPSRYRAGILGGSLLGYANMALVCTLFFWNYQGDEEDSRDDNRFLENNQDDDRENAERDGSAPFALLCIVLCALYTLLAVIVIWKHSSLIAAEELTGPDPTGTVSPDEQTMIQSTAIAHVLSDVWNSLCVLGIVALLINLIMAPLVLWQEDAERVREEGEIWNYILIIAWVLIFLTILYLVGRGVFGQRKATSQVAIGAFNGELFFFAALAFMVAVFYTSINIGRGRRPEEGTYGSGGFCVICYFLAGTFGAFAIGVAKHHKSIIRATAKDIYSVEQWREPFMCGEMT